MVQSIADLHEIVKSRDQEKRLVLAAGEDVYALRALSEAELMGYVKPIVVGDVSVIRNILDNNQIAFVDLKLVHVAEQQQAVDEAVRLVSSGQAEILMKGASSTAVLLKSVLNKEWGLRQGELLSHLAVFELPGYHKLLSLTDVAINIAPGVGDKVEMIRNALQFLGSLGMEDLKVAMITAVEKVYDSMPATVQAKEVVELIRKDSSFPSCLIDGPFAFDNATDREGALHKGINSPVAGDADLLVLPQIEAGNILYKALAIFAQAKIAAVVLGAKAPVVLTSRADSDETKLNSILLAAAGC